MISQVDIDDWEHIDFEKLIEDIPEEERKVNLKDGPDGELIIDMAPFVNAFGKALVARIKLSLKV